MKWLYYHLLYQPLMRLMHRFDLHYMPACYPDHDKMIWCHWCGARYVVPDYEAARRQLREANAAAREVFTAEKYPVDPRIAAARAKQ